MVSLVAKPVVEKIHTEVRHRVEKFTQAHGRAPKLSVILVGNDNASIIYTQKKGELATILGMEHETITFPQDASANSVRDCVQRLNSDSFVDGILIQRPLPKAFREEEVLFWVNPDKDVDAFHPLHAGKLLLGLPAFQPCTPAGVMELLKHYQIPTTGQVACVVGRSPIVGKPMAVLLLQANATVIQCHSKTKSLPEMTRQADILVVAAGKPGLIQAGHVKPGSVVIDVGIHRTASGKLAGDVNHAEVSSLVSAISPVPGGVGPMTLAILMRNTIRAAELRAASQRQKS